MRICLKARYNASTTHFDQTKRVSLTIEPKLNWPGCTIGDEVRAPSPPERKIPPGVACEMMRIQASASARVSKVADTVSTLRRNWTHHDLFLHRL